MPAALEPPDWGLLARLFGEDLHPGGAKLTKSLLDAVDARPGASVLDLGCGPAKPVTNARWVGVDPAPRPGSATTLVRGDGRLLPVRDASMDAAVSECVLSLIDPLAPALREIRRVLRPGGRFGFTDFTAARAIDWVAPEYARWACLDRKRGVADWKRALDAAGFKDVVARDESWALREIEERVNARVDVLGVLDALAASGGGPYRRAAGFLRQARSLRDDGVLGYHLFVASA